MNNSPLISVIVPVYKVEPYLERCVNSIINQTYKNLEIILVDDGSPDNCGKICDELAIKDNRIKVIHKQNEGQSKARNEGLDIAQGEFITFVDSDDWLETEAYQLLISMIKDSDIAIFGHKTVRDEIPFENDNFGNIYLNSEGLWDEVLGELNNAVWNKLFKSELLKDIRFLTDVYHGEDLIFNLNYIKKCKNGVINKTPMYHYFKHPDSVTTSNFSEKRFMEIISKDAVLDLVKTENPKFIKTAEKYCFRARMNVLRAIYKSNLQAKYYRELEVIKNYIFSNFKNTSRYLKLKEKVEFYILKYFRGLYKKIVKFI